MLTVQLLGSVMLMDIETTQFPIVGEPLPVEFANTLYLRPGYEIDFLATPSAVVTWFDLVAVGSPSPIPRHLDNERCRDVRRIRDAVHAVLTAVTQVRTSGRATAEPTDAVRALNDGLGDGGARYVLSWSKEGRPSASVQSRGSGFVAARTFLAAQSVSFIAGPDLDRVRRCESPDCPMFFVQQHRKRRFCHEGCAHRARQARYYWSQRTAV